jgi:DNA polymerase III subunit beta
MKLTIHQSALVQMLQTVSKAVAVRTTKHVLMGILLETTNEGLTATAYDLELGIQTHLIANEENELSILDPGAIVLPARYALDVVKKLPSEPITLQVSNNYMTEIQTASVQFHLHGIDAAEFPKLPVFHNAKSVHLQSDVLKRLIRSTTFATSTSEVRPILTGIHLQSTANQLKFTATDGLRLATRHVDFESTTSDEWNVILPAKSLNELLKILPDDNRSVQIQFTNSHSLFSVDDTLFYTRLIDGAYPDTSRIIPNAHKTEVILSANEITHAIDRAALIARDRDNHMIRLELQDQTITVSSSSPEIGNVSESVHALSKIGDDMQIAFNAKYVLDALKAMETDELSIQFSGGNQPFVIRQHGQEDGLQLISPVLMR